MAKYLGIKKELKKLADPKRAAVSKWFFKTGKGEYGEGDIFIGLTVPQQRKIAAKYQVLPQRDIAKLLQSKVHEERLIALFILINRFDRSGMEERERIAKFYLESTKFINNWDLVDSSASQILGAYLQDKPREILTKLARSKNIWERRIAIIATYRFIKRGKFANTLVIAKLLLADKHDLIHKAVGWMLREVGKRSQATEVKFLNKYYKSMPRTMLRYALERLPIALRQRYMIK